MQWELSGQINQTRKEILSEPRRNELWEHILHETDSGVSTAKYADCDVIVSVTSYSQRMLEAALAIESIMEQTMKANRIVLWVAHEDFKHIPISLKMLQARGLEIMECDDLRSYKKLIPSLRQFPKDVIITIDDDVFYNQDILERLISAYQKNPTMIYCSRAYRVGLTKEGLLLPYGQWISASEKDADRRNFFVGSGGVLYPPHCLDEEVFRENVFMDISKYADDVWFFAMALKKGTRISRVSSATETGEDYQLNRRVQSNGLYHINVENENLNDIQFKAVIEKYSLYEKLFEY